MQDYFYIKQGIITRNCKLITQELIELLGENKANEFFENCKFDTCAMGEDDPSDPVCTQAEAMLALAQEQFGTDFDGMEGQ